MCLPHLPLEWARAAPVSIWPRHESQRRGGCLMPIGPKSVRWVVSTVWSEFNYLCSINGFLQKTWNKSATRHLSISPLRGGTIPSASLSFSCSISLDPAQHTTASRSLASKLTASWSHRWHLHRALPPLQSDHCQLKNDIFSSVRALFVLSSWLLPWQPLSPLLLLRSQLHPQPLVWKFILSQLIFWWVVT